MEPPGGVREGRRVPLEGMGHLDEAVTSYREAVRLNREQAPHSAWPPVNLATLLTKMGDRKAGEELLREALGYDGKLAEAHYRLGVNLKGQGRNQEALAELKAAVELDPEATEPLYVLGQMYAAEGNQQAATAAFDRFRALKQKRRKM